MELCIISRDELRIVDLDEIDFIKACGNYSDFHYRNGVVKCELFCLSHYDSVIASLYGSNNPFYRLGRSLLVNIRHVCSVNIRMSTLTFKGNGTKIIVPRTPSKELKNFFEAKYAKNVQTPNHGGSDSNSACLDSMLDQC